MDNVNRASEAPSAVTEPKMTYKLIYERETCTRCGGGGRYSYCQMHGTTCFKCGGKGTTTTRSGKKAAAAIEAFMAEHFSVAVEDLKPGDRFREDGKTLIVKSVQTSGGSRFGYTDPATGESVMKDYVTITLARAVRTAFGPMTDVAKIPGTKVVRAVSGADWDAVVAFARTIKRGISIVEDLKAVTA
jgi:hypothetical protein